MRSVVQRVSEASVKVDGTVVGEIDAGLCVLLGVEASDTEADLNWMVQKVVGLRVFEDADGLMNLDIGEVGGKMLVVSQFTLLGDCRKGRRPSFVAAARPEFAEPVYDAFCDRIRAVGIDVATGRFRTEMAVSIVNDGPVTLLLDSRRQF